MNRMSSYKILHENRDDSYDILHLINRRVRQVPCSEFLDDLFVTLLLFTTSKLHFDDKMKRKGLKSRRRLKTTTTDYDWRRTRIFRAFIPNYVHDKNGGRLAAGLRSTAFFPELVKNGLWLQTSFTEGKKIGSQVGHWSRVPGRPLHPLGLVCISLSFETYKCCNLLSYFRLILGNLSSALKNKITLHYLLVYQQ